MAAVASVFGAEHDEVMVRNVRCARCLANGEGVLVATVFDLMAANFRR